MSEPLMTVAWAAMHAGEPVQVTMHEWQAKAWAEAGGEVVALGPLPHPEHGLILERWAFEYAALCVQEATRNINEQWHAALERRFPPDEVAEAGWKVRMVLYDANGDPCAHRQPSHVELREALHAPEWPHSGA